MRLDFIVDWANTTHWRVTPLPRSQYALAPQEWVGTPIAELADQQLWETVNWCVIYSPSLRDAATNTAVVTDEGLRSPRMEDNIWLSQQPAFIALVNEAVRRELTFAPGTMNFLQRYMLPATRQGPPPWRDPNRLRSQSQFHRLVQAHLANRAAASAAAAVRAREEEETAAREAAEAAAAAIAAKMPGQRTLRRHIDFDA